MKAENGWRPYRAVKAERGHEGRDKAGMRPLGPNGATETRLWRLRRGHGGWDEAVEAEQGRKGQTRVVEAKRGRGGWDKAVEAVRAKWGRGG